MLTREQIITNINALEQQGAKPDEIQEWLDSLKTTQQSTESVQQKTPAQQPQQDFLSKAAGIGEKVLGFTGGKRVAEVGANLLTGQSLPESVKGAGGVKRVAGDVAKLGAFTAPLGAGVLPTIGKRLLFGGGVGAAISGASATERGETLPQIAGKTAVGFGTGVAITGAFEGASRLAQKAIQKVAPKILSYTSDTPELVIEKQILEPQKSAEVLKSLKGQPRTAPLKTTQDAVVGLRAKLSNEYSRGADYIAQKFANKRVGFNSSEERLLRTVAREYKNVLEIPQNTKSMSVKEMLNLNKSVNELFKKRAVKEAAQGINVRKFKDLLRGKMVDNFGGKGGEVDTLLKNYSNKLDIFNNADDIVKAYKLKPTQQATALSKLDKIFREDKSAYLSAIQDLERESGKSIVDVLAAQKVKPFIPTKEGKFTFEDIFRIILTPITSPRLTGMYSRGLGRLAQAAQKTKTQDALRQIILQLIANLQKEPEQRE